jgi:hypothetical protein
MGKDENRPKLPPVEDVCRLVMEEKNIPTEENTKDKNTSEDQMGERLERLGGEPAPVITPEEFARLQKDGQVHIDSRGRVRTSRRSDAEAGVSLRKRRAWYTK